ncbi:MAG: hypothetical protein AAFY84_01200 [Pseudomonadota bacterium]
MSMRTIILALLSFGLCACVSVSESDEIIAISGWELVYANDAEGNEVEGNKDDLIRAVRDGQPVRVYFGGGRVEHVADAQFLTVFEGEVFAQIEAIDAQRPMTEPARIEFRDPGQEWRAITGTNGTWTTRMDGADPRQARAAFRWFVSK